MIAEDGGLDEALASLTRVPRLLVALDFDGTVAPLVEDPATARPTPAAREAVARLAGLPATSVAYVSGRQLSELGWLTGADDAVVLVGSHGAETSAGPRDAFALSAPERRRLDALRQAVARVHDRFPRARIEQKPAGVGVHVRGLETGLGHAVFGATRAAVEKVVPEVGAYVIREGKGILEFAVRDVTKADAIRSLRASTRADAVFFAGDDVTDEDGFQALEGAADVGVKVGEGVSAAPFRVADPAALGALVARLAVLRAAWAAA
ncbi:MAG TPA: trehalose-phosphatase [Microbacteriaceae bacterium]|nr:trehalose-phosphatase [Microbacteriaceae bacterium]